MTGLIGPVSVGEIAAAIDGTVVGDFNLKLDGISTLDRATPRELSFLSRSRYRDQAAASGAGCIIVAGSESLVGRTLIVVSDPQLGYLRAMRLFFPRARPQSWISPHAVIDESAVIDDGVRVEAGAVIGARSAVGSGTTILSNASIGEACRIGRDCEVHYGARLYPGTILGDRVVVYANAVIGADGFGFHLRGERPERIPQVGRVVLQDDVEVGPSVCIERATLNETVVGSGSKVGAHSYVGHNVVIGENTVIIGQTGISGSSTIGSRCRIWGRVAIRGHITVGDGSTVLATSFVTGDVPPNSTVAGSPAWPHMQWKRAVAFLKRASSRERSERDRRN